MKFYYFILVWFLQSCAGNNNGSLRNDHPLSYFRELVINKRYDLIAKEYCVRPFIIKGELDQDPIIKLISDKEVEIKLKFFFETDIYINSHKGFLELSNKAQQVSTSQLPEISKLEGNIFYWCGIKFYYDQPRGVLKISGVNLDTSSDTGQRRGQ